MEKKSPLGRSSVGKLSASLSDESLLMMFQDDEDPTRKVTASDIESRFAVLLVGCCTRFGRVVSLNPPFMQEHTLMLPSEAREKMTHDFTVSQKWTLLQQQTRRARASTKPQPEGTVKSTPEYMVSQLMASATLDVYRALRVCISTEPAAWLRSFADKKGARARADGWRVC